MLLDDSRIRASQVALVVKNPPANAGDGQCKRCGSIPRSGRSPGGDMVTHSSILAWRIPWTEEPGGQQSTGSQRVGHQEVYIHTEKSGHSPGLQAAEKLEFELSFSW